MQVNERLAVRRLKVIRLRGVRTTMDTGEPETNAGFGPIDLDVEAGTLVAVTPPASGRALLDVLDGTITAQGRIELAGSVLAELTVAEQVALRRRSLARVTMSADGSAALPAGGSVVTVRQSLAATDRRPRSTPVGPSLPLLPVMDRRLAELDAPTRGLVAIAHALRSNADVLLLDAAEVPPGSTVTGTLAGPVRDLVDLEGRTVVVTVGDPALLRVAEEVIDLTAAP